MHLLVTAGGLSAQGAQWIAPKKASFLAPEGVLAITFRAKMCAALNQAGLLPQVPPQVRKKDWVVHCKAAGSGRKVLEYLGRYVFRVAITNSRLERIQDGQVTFRYRHNHTQRLRRATLPAMEFIGHFLQHVLPPGCTKVRYYGLWSNSCRRQLEQARAQARQCLPPRFPGTPAGRSPPLFSRPGPTAASVAGRATCQTGQKSTPVYSPEAPNPR